MSDNFIRHIGLCGAPRAGKSTLAEVISERWGGTIIDDGMVLRLACMSLYGLSWVDVNTQEGKAQLVTVCGRQFAVRNLLGDLGNLLEAKYGEQFMPERAVKNAAEATEQGFAIYPSVRKTQGLTYRNIGGLVIEVVRNGCDSINDFDQYDKSLVNYTIDNNGSIDDMVSQFKAIMREEYSRTGRHLPSPVRRL